MKSLLSLLLFSLFVVNLHGQTTFINEIHYDNASTDTGEAIELAGPEGTSIEGWQLILYNGSTGASYNTINLTHTFSNQSGGYGFYVIDLPSNGLQNGAPDGIALVDNSNNVIQFISYEGSFMAVDGAANGLNSVDIGVAENSSTPIGYSLQLTGSGLSYDDFSWAAEGTSTFGSVNTGQTFDGTPLILEPVINEFVFNHTGSDAYEYIEVYGSPDTDYSTYTLLEIEGDGTGAGTIDEVIPLGMSDANGYWFSGYLSNALENGTVSLLLVTDFTGSIGDDLDTDNDGILDITPWTAITDDVGVNDNGADDRNYSTVVLTQNFDGSTFTVGGASRFPNGEDTDSASDWVRNDFDGEGFPGYPVGTTTAGEAFNTPETENHINDEIVVANNVIINEIDADTPGTDAVEFIELFDGGTGNTSLDGLFIVLFNGNGDAAYDVIALDGYSTNPEGYFVLGSSDVANVDLVTFTTNGLQNGADAVALYAGNSADFPSGTVVTTDNLVDAIVYDTDDADDTELLVLLNASEPQVNENQNGNKDNESLQRIPNGEGGKRNTSAYQAATPTPGTENGAVVVVELVTIAEARALPDGTDVKVTGTLTVSDQFGGSAYIQDTSGGIAVFDTQLHGNGLFSIGDSVTITGVRSSYSAQIQISGLTELISHGPADFPIQPIVVNSDELSMYAGQLVQLSDIDFESKNDLIFGNSNYNAMDVAGTFEVRFDADVAAIVGMATPEEACSSVIGVVGKYYDIYQLLPRQLLDIPCLQDYVDPADAIAVDPDITLDIATWNIEWFGDDNNAPAADAIQKDSVKNVLLALNADIIAVEEITDVVLFEQMISELPGYDYVLSDAVSYPQDASEKQRVGFIYQTDVITGIETKALLSSIHPYYNGGDASYLTGYPDAPDRFYASGRLPFLLTATVQVNGQESVINFIALHARANSPSDAYGRYLMRQYDVAVLKDSLDAQYGDQPLVILGDFNDDLDETVADIAETTLSSYATYTSDPAHYSFPTLALSEAGKRSYVFRENMIDHIVLSDELGANYIDGSASVGYAFYDSDYANTTSDHMPVKIRLFLSNECQGGEVVSFEQGTRKNGRDVHKFRSIPEKAIGAPYENWWYNFVSLGFGGSITIKMNNPVFDIDGDDFEVVESTAGPFHIQCDYYPEKAEVLVSEDGIAFTSLGITCQDGKFDLNGSGLSYANYIQVKDVSNPDDFWHPNADGYDLDGIICLSDRTNARGSKDPFSNYAPNEEPYFEIVNEPYPNPASQEFRLHISSENTMEIRSGIYNELGRMIKGQHIQLTRGINEIKMDVDQLKRGIYILKIESEQDELNKNFKIVLQ